MFCSLLQTKTIVEEITTIKATLKGNNTETSWAEQGHTLSYSVQFGPIDINPKIAMREEMKSPNKSCKTLKISI